MRTGAAEATSPRAVTPTNTRDSPPTCAPSAAKTSSSSPAAAIPSIPTIPGSGIGITISARKCATRAFSTTSVFTGISTEEPPKASPTRSFTPLFGDLLTMERDIQEADALLSYFYPDKFIGLIIDEWGRGTPPPPRKTATSSLPRYATASSPRRPQSVQPLRPPRHHDQHRPNHQRAPMHRGHGRRQDASHADVPRL